MVLEAVKGEKTIAEIASEYNVVPRSVVGWEKEFLENMDIIFAKDKAFGDMEEQIKENEKYPYLLKEIEITKPNQVWATNITYIWNGSGFLVAIIDWYSRSILSFITTKEDILR